MSVLAILSASSQSHVGFVQKLLFEFLIISNVYFLGINISEILIKSYYFLLSDHSVGFS